MNDTKKEIKSTQVDPKPTSPSVLLHSATCKLNVIRAIDPDEMKIGDFYGVRYILDEVLKELELIDEQL